MGYPSQVLFGQLATPFTNAHLTAANLAATAADWAVWNIHSPVILKRVSFFVTLNVAASTLAPRITFYKRPTSNSTAGQVVLANLNILTGATVGQVYYKDITTSPAARLSPGHDLAVAVSVQCTDAGTAAGKGFAHWYGELDPEYVGNLTNMVASS